jgi:hypothetical protein
MRMKTRLRGRRVFPTRFLYFLETLMLLPSRRQVRLCDRETGKSLCCTTCPGLERDLWMKPGGFEGAIIIRYDVGGR